MSETKCRHPMKKRLWEQIHGMRLIHLDRETKRMFYQTECGICKKYIKVTAKPKDAV